MRRLEYDGEFFFVRSSLGAVSKGATPVKYTDICHFEHFGINAEKFQNTRIRFNSDVFANLTVVTFNAPYIPNGRVTANYLYWKSYDRRRKIMMIRWKSCLFYKTLWI